MEYVKVSLYLERNTAATRYEKHHGSVLHMSPVSCIQTLVFVLTVFLACVTGPWK